MNKYHTLFITTPEDKVIMHLDFDERADAIKWAASVKAKDINTEIVERSDASVFDSLWMLTPEERSYVDSW